mmetsp:Transcript_36567/g.102180  ORF Transcript_36567/g.102180 Transcript_36567/m.102180 type:complete len:93 (+) Transcript_36567:179-457(+)
MARRRPGKDIAVPLLLRKPDAPVRILGEGAARLEPRLEALSRLRSRIASPGIVRRSRGADTAETLLAKEARSTPPMDIAVPEPAEESRPSQE